MNDVEAVDGGECDLFTTNDIIQHSQDSNAAVDSKPNKAFPWKLFLFSYFGWTFDFLDLVIIGFVKDDIKKDLHMTENLELLMLGVSLGSSGLGGIFSGFLADRFGKAKLLTATILIYSLGSLICGTSPNWGVFLFGRFVVGLGVGGERTLYIYVIRWAIGHSLIAEAVDKNVRGRSAALLQTGEPVGVILAAFLSYLIVPMIGWRWMMILLSSAGLIALILRRFLAIPEQKSTDHIVRCSELRSHNLHILYYTASAYLLGVFKLGTYWSIYTWLPSFLKKEMHQGVGKSLEWVATAQVGQFLGMLAFGVVSDFLGRRVSFTLYSFLTAIAIGALAYQWEVLERHDGLFWTTMFSLGIGSGCTAGFGALLAELFPTQIRTFLMGTTYNVARMTQILSPFVVNYAYKTGHGGLSSALTVPLTLALLTGTWVWVLPETRGIVLPSLMTRRERKENEEVNV